MHDIRSDEISGERNELLASCYMRNSISFEVVLERPRGDFSIQGGYGAYTSHMKFGSKTRNN